MRPVWVSLATVSLACGSGSPNIPATADTAPDHSTPPPAPIEAERLAFQPLPSRFYPGEQYGIDVVLEDQLGRRATAPVTVSLSFEPNDQHPQLAGTLQVRSDPGVAHFEASFDRPARQVVLRATLPSGVWGLSQPFDVVSRSPEPQAAPWVPAGPGGAPVNVVAVAPDDPNLIFAATNRGLYRSRDGGVTWTAAPAAGVENRAFTELVTASATTLYVMSDGVYVSRDGGDSFTAIEGGLPRSDYGGFAFIFSLARQPLTGDLWGLNQGLRRFDATDSQWKAVPGGEKLRAFWLAPSDPKTLYAKGDEGFLVSHDAGSTWTVRTSLTSGWMISSLAVDPSDASVLLASKYPEGLIRSNDAGVTWSTLSAEQAGGVWFATSHRAYTLQTAKLYRSDDGGQTWTQVSSLPDGFAALAFDPRDPSVMFAGFSRYVRGGGVYKSTDGGATWMHASEGIHGANIEALSADRRIGAVFVGTASGLYRTIDKGATFQRVGERSARVAESPDGALYAAADQELLRSSDGGLHWEVVREGQVTGPVAIHPKDSRLLILAATGRLLRSTDRGGTWNEVLCRCEIGSYSTFTSLLFDGDTVLAATQREYKGIGGLFRSTDAGASWTALNAFDTGSLAFDPLHSGALLASVGIQVGRSTDGGQTWTGLYSGKRYIRSLAVDPSGTLWAGASAQCTSSFGLACPRAGGGVLRSGDGGATWTEPHPSIEGLSVRELLVDPRDPNTVYLGSDEGGLWITHSAGR